MFIDRNRRESSRRRGWAQTATTWLIRASATAFAVAAMLAGAATPAHAWDARTIEGSPAERSNTTTPAPPNEEQCSLGARDVIKGLFDFSWACYAHDVCYQNHQLNGIVRDRAGCDAIFLAKMKAECKSRHRRGLKRSACNRVAATYYRAVRSPVGEKTWKSWRGRHCVTVPGENAKGIAYIIQVRCHWGENQRFTFTSRGEVRPRHTKNKCLHISGASHRNGASVLQYACNGAPYQRFTFTRSGELRAKHSGKCVDVRGASHADGARVHQYTCNGRANQQFKFTARGELRPRHGWPA